MAWQIHSTPLILALKNSNRRWVHGDVVCDTLMLEEILPRLHPVSLLRLAAAARRHDALARDPAFAARYWQRAGVFFTAYLWRRPRFLPGPGADQEGHARMSGADLGFLPGPSVREKAYLRRVGAGPDGAVAVMHSAAGGLLLCSRGYVCNPVTCQWVALPELPWRPHGWQSGLLTLDAAAAAAGDDDDGAGKKKSNPIKRFQVALLNHPMHWRDPAGGSIHLSSFSSDTGQWKATQQLQPPPVARVDGYHFLAPSGTAYWTTKEDQAVAYNSVGHSIQLVPASSSSNP